MMTLEIRKGKLQIEGYVNAVERYSKEIKENGKTFFEKIESGAFTRALENNKNVQMFFNHNPQRILAEQKNNNLFLEEDNIGLKVRAIIDDNEIIEEARKGNLTGWSFGFGCIEDSWEENKRSIRDLHLFEVSLLTVEPAYIGTSVEIRSEDNVISKSIRSGKLNLREEQEETETDKETKEPETKEEPEETSNLDKDIEEKRQMQLQGIDLEIFLNNL